MRALSRACPSCCCPYLDLAWGSWIRLERHSVGRVESTNALHACFVGASPGNRRSWWLHSICCVRVHANPTWNRRWWLGTKKLRRFMQATPSCIRTALSTISNCLRVLMRCVFGPMHATLLQSLAKSATFWVPTLDSLFLCATAPFNRLQASWVQRSRCRRSPDLWLRFSSDLSPLTDSCMCMHGRSSSLLAYSLQVGRNVL